MGKSVDLIIHSIGNHFNSKGNYFIFEPPLFLTDPIPSWQSSEFQLPIKITLDSEVIYAMDDLPKTQKRDRSLWNEHSEK